MVATLPTHTNVSRPKRMIMEPNTTAGNVEKYIPGAKAIILSIFQPAALEVEFNVAAFVVSVSVGAICYVRLLCMVGTLGTVTYVTLHTTWRTPKRVRNNYDHWGIMLHVRGYFHISINSLDCCEYSWDVR